ncbi:putative nucleic acid-binding Zn-ribbon protein [Anaerosolibacter carboniphilus]|uniref:Putative nucleic acid-binding Zn-ribbon protein n=1 Tax=Anaerosolibacter carboniphilus TaxID=1417629 RepID=A0A841KNF3_9FIRM|nr:hypothetical protein [Anaerosolibacter carboniphilus]MBB6214967.1 putative nucleic acid-binding Zn-ribbon protein [Anaerosolibacter carboniphilus]
MKVKVVKKFRDKHTTLIHQKDQELEITQERFEEINSTSLGVFVEEIHEIIEETQTEEEKLSSEEIQKEEKSIAEAEAPGENEIPKVEETVKTTENKRERSTKK